MILAPPAWRGVCASGNPEGQEANGSNTSDSFFLLNFIDLLFLSFGRTACGILVP